MGTGKGNSVLEILKTVEKVMGAKFTLNFTNIRRGEYGRMIASNKKAKKILNWRPTRSIEDSVASLVKWYKIRPQGWES